MKTKNIDLEIKELCLWYLRMGKDMIIFGTVLAIGGMGWLVADKFLF